MGNKYQRSLYHGELDFNGIKISCAVLEDNTRVLVNRSLAKALGIKGSGAYWEKKREGSALLPEYLSAKYLRPYISEELYEKLSKPIPYINIKGVLTEGIPATLLTDICNVYIQAEKNGALSNNQALAETAYKMLLAFSKIGIIALIDEATGYQHDRERNELQQLLKQFISEELLPWQKRFPDIFYKELFRLNGWDYTIKDIRKRPRIVGKWTNELIYKQLPPKVLEELKKKTPKSASGNYTARFHQSLTEDIGHSTLQNQITQIVTIFRLSDNMKQMWDQFDKIRLKQSGQLEIPFVFDEEGHTIETEPSKEDDEPLSNFNSLLTQALHYNPHTDIKNKEDEEFF